MPTTSTSWNPALFDPRFTAITLDIANREDFYNQVTQAENGANRSKFPDPTTVRTQHTEGTGPLQQVYEGSGNPEDQPIREPQKTSTYKEFGLKLVFSHLMLEDDLTGMCNDIVAQAAEGSPLLKNLEVAKLYENGNNTTYYTTAYGEAIYGSHTTEASAARYNLLGYAGSGTINGSVGYTTLQELLTMGWRQRNHRGYPDPSFKKGDKLNLWTAPEDDWLIEKILGPNSRFEPSTEYAQPNVLASKNITANSTPFLSASGFTTARPFFIINPSRMPVWLVQREPLRTWSTKNDDTESMITNLRERWGFHVEDWRGTYAGGF